MPDGYRIDRWCLQKSSSLRYSKPTKCVVHRRYRYNLNSECQAVNRFLLCTQQAFEEWINSIESLVDIHFHLHFSNFKLDINSIWTALARHSFFELKIKSRRCIDTGMSCMSLSRATRIFTLRESANGCVHPRLPLNPFVLSTHRQTHKSGPTSM